MVSKLQSRFKGLLWRVRLAKMKLAAVVVQAMVRHAKRGMMMKL
jgi:hypothetical protein